jgi:tRNA pseudouridine55 synthase
VTDSTSGLVVVDKAGGMTSHDVVARVRRLAGTRKVGHAGTLDPMATGVLVLGINRATRLLGHLLLTDKSYDATVRLGVATTTDDAEGEVTSTASTEGITADAVREALAGFVGQIDQVPAAVSAIKVDGKRAYHRVRAGEQVELSPRPVRIDEIRVHDVVGDEVSFSVRCSSGTYVRALARDLGERLGTGGHLTALRRTAAGPYTLDQARTLDQLEAEFETLGMDEAVRQAFPALELDEAQAADVSFGRKLPIDLGLAGPVALFAPDGGFLALYVQEGECARAVAVFA